MLAEVPRDPRRLRAKKARYGAKDLPALFQGARRIAVCKGAKVTELTPPNLDPAIVLCPTGNRAPRPRAWGRDCYVDFGETMWKELLGASA